MPVKNRIKTKYPGVYFIEGISAANGKPENFYYIVYRLDGVQYEEPVGRQYRDDMTPAKAALIRAEKLNKNIPPNKIKRQNTKTEPTLNQLWDYYKSNKTIKSIRQDNYNYINHVQGVIGKKTVARITHHDFDKLRNTMTEMKPQTIYHVLSLIRRIINFAVSRRLCLPLAFKIEMPRFDNKKTEDLSAAQVQILLNILDSESYREAAVFMKIAIFTGMRKSEILRLKWSDVDFDRKFIYLPDTKGGMIEKIPLNSHAENAIKELYNTVTYSAGKYLFPSKSGGLRSRDSFNKPLRRIRKKAGISEDFRPMHGLRHVFASTLASSGKVDMYTLQKLLTHKSPQMTQRYAHLRDEALARASEETDNIFDGLAGDKKEL